MNSPFDDARATETVGERLRRLRSEQGKSQREISGPGVSHAYISRIEAGSRAPSVKALRVLAGRLGVTPEYLETGTEVPPSDARELRLGDAELRLRLGDHGLETREELKSLLREAVAANEPALITRAEIVLGLAAFENGDHSEAVAYLANAVTSPETSPLTHAGVYVTLAKAWRFVGRGAEAAQMLEDSISELEILGEDGSAARVRFATYLSYALTDVGEFERARDVLIEAKAGTPSTDPRNQVRLYWSLARVSYMEGQARMALREMRRAIVLLDQTEDELELARAHLFCAEVHLWADDLEAARIHLALAGRLDELNAAHRDLGTLASGNALLHARRYESKAALREAGKALELLADAPTEQGMAHFAVGIAAEQLGDIDRSSEAFEAGIDSLVSSSMMREAALVAHEWAAALRDAGRLDEAADAAERARELHHRATSVMQRQTG